MNRRALVVAAAVGEAGSTDALKYWAETLESFFTITERLGISAWN